MKNNEVKKIVKEAFDKSKSAGYKKIRKKVAASYTRLSNKKVLEITKGDIQYKQFSVRFTNKVKSLPFASKPFTIVIKQTLWIRLKSILNIKVNVINTFFQYYTFFQDFTD